MVIPFRLSTVAITPEVLRERYWTMVSIETGSNAGALRHGSIFVNARVRKRACVKGLTRRARQQAGGEGTRRTCSATNVPLYPRWQAFPRERQPKTIIFWSQDDVFLTKEGGEAYLKDLPNAEMHWLVGGDFAAEDSLDYISMTGHSGGLAPFPLDALPEGFFCFHSRRIDTHPQRRDINGQDDHREHPAQDNATLVLPPRDHHGNQQESRETQGLAD
jgi:hypothetical protein